LKRLYLLRHAKADWSVEVVHDRHRPLEERGRKDAARVGEFLRDLGQIPEVVISSPAVRAETTARLAIKAGSWDLEAKICEDLYDTPPWKVIRELRQLDDDCESVLLSFHEPTCSETLSDLVGHVSVRMPTAAVARIDLQAEAWEDVEPGVGTLAWLVTPKILKAG
jgi:phosphohistidine phosphatase